MRIRTLAAFGLIAAISACGAPATDEAEMDGMADAADMADAAATMAEITDYWQTHYNMGHGGMVADRFAPEGLMWGSSGTHLYGSGEIGAGLQSRIDAEGTQVAIHPGESMGFGDRIVSRGHYVLTGAPDAAEVRNSGYYMTLAERLDGEWLLQGMVANFDTPDHMLSPGAKMEMPEGMGGDLIQAAGDYFATHLNMGHAGMVAGTFTEDAVVMLPNESAREGRAAVQEGLQAMLDAGTTFAGMTPWRAHELDDGHVVGLGTYATEGAGGAGGGHYAALFARGEDGGLMFHWLLMGQTSGGM